MLCKCIFFMNWFIVHVDPGPTFCCNCCLLSVLSVLHVFGFKLSSERCRCLYCVSITRWSKNAAVFFDRYSSELNCFACKSRHSHTQDLLFVPFHRGSFASNLEQVANLLRAQVNSASYPQRDGKWVVAYGLWGEGPVWLIGAVVCLLAANRGSSCSLPRAVDSALRYH